jgi:hypothetical protein
MSRKIIVYEDFYKDPDQIRQMAIKDKTLRLVCSDFNDLAVSIIGAFTKSTSKTNNGGFTFDIEKKDKITYDLDDKWTCIVFLTPDEYAAPDTGIKFWMNKNNNSLVGSADTTSEPIDKTSIISGYKTKKNKSFDLDLGRWECDQFIKGKYNRAVFFRSNLYHSFGNGFGSGDQDCKLTQMFFFGDSNESH